MQLRAEIISLEISAAIVEILSNRSLQLMDNKNGACGVARGAKFIGIQFLIERFFYD
jgi:hypothetical protein